MAKLRKRQHEEFCIAYAQYPNAGDAAAVAGYEHLNRYTQGYRLMRRPDILARIAELREDLAARDCQSVGVLLAKLEGAFVDALKSKNALAAVRVIELQAKLGGHLGAPRGRAKAAADTEDDGGDAMAEDVKTIVANPARFAVAQPISDETARAGLAAVARSSARKRGVRL